MKNKRPLRSKQKPYMTVLKVILVVLTLIYPVFMTMMTGVGIIHNKSSYGEEITSLGVQPSFRELSSPLALCSAFSGRACLTL